MRLLFILLFSGLISTSYSQDREFTYMEGDTEYHMKMYYMLIYIRGEKSEEFKGEELEEIQKGHLAHISKMAEAGAVKIAGPLEGDQDKRGILIFDVDSKEEVVTWIEQDPAVIAGRLTYEIYGWWAEKGACLE